MQKRKFGVAAAAVMAFGLAAALMFGGAGRADAKEIVIRIGSGHPPTVVYAGLMKTFFEPELKKAIESKTKHTVKFIEGYSGSIVKVFDTFEGVQNGVLDIGGFCICFEASKLPMNAFQIMLPFGTMDPEMSVAIAVDVYKKFPILDDRVRKVRSDPCSRISATAATTSAPTFRGNKCPTSRVTRSSAPAST